MRSPSRLIVILICLCALTLSAPVCVWGAGSDSIVGWGSQVVGPIDKVVKVAGGSKYSLGLKPDGSIGAWGSNGSGVCNVPSPNTGFAAVAAGGGQSLGLKADGSVVAWGRNDYGQCNVPSPNTGFAAVAAGGGHSLGLKADGSVVAWGSNSSGECNVPTPNTGFVAVAAGSDHSLGLKADGSIVVWGCNSYGQCNVPSPNTGFAAVSAGYHYSLGLKEDGSIVAWGWNDFGQCNVPSPNTGFAAVSAGYDHSLGLKADGSIVAWGYNNNGQCNVPAPNTGFAAVSAGCEHSLGLKADGSIVAWGWNDCGQCNVPLPNTGFAAVAAGRYHSLGLKADGSLVAWGWNRRGVCNVPSPNTGFMAVVAGESHSLGLKADGSVLAWGDNEYGQCNLPLPNTGFVGIAAGYNHSLGLKADGSVLAWGSNSTYDGHYAGQCSVPSPNTGFVAVAAGTYYSLGLKANGSIVAWGYNNYGQRNVPSPNTEFVAVAAGLVHSLGLKANGSIVAWGDNSYGQCSVPSPNTGFVAVATGWTHSLGLRADGSVVAWGDNECGQCNVSSPNIGFVAVAAGYGYSIGINGTGSGTGTPVTVALSPSTVEIGQPLTVTAYALGATSVRLRCEGVTRGFPELSMLRSSGSSFTLSFPTSFLMFARGSTVKFVAYATSPGGATSSGSAILRIRDVAQPTPGSLHLETDDTYTFGLADSTYEPIVQTADCLEAKLLMTHYLNLWFHLRASASEGATASAPTGGSIEEVLGYFGVANPKGTVAWMGEFSDAGQSVTMSLAFDGTGGLLTILEIVLKVVPGGSGVSPASLAAFYPEFREIGAIYSAAKAFNSRPSSGWEWAETVRRVVWALRGFAASPEQRVKLCTALSHIGIHTSESALKNVFTAMTIYDVLRIIGSECVYAIETKCDDLKSTFTSHRDSNGLLGVTELPKADATLYRTKATIAATDPGALSVAPSVTASEEDWLISYNVTNNGRLPGLVLDCVLQQGVRLPSPSHFTNRLDLQAGLRAGGDNLVHPGVRERLGARQLRPEHDCGRRVLGRLLHPPLCSSRLRAVQRGRCHLRSVVRRGTRARRYRQRLRDEAATRLDAQGDLRSGSDRRAA